MCECFDVCDVDFVHANDVSIVVMMLLDVYFMLELLAWLVEFLELLWA